MRHNPIEGPFSVPPRKHTPEEWIAFVAFVIFLFAIFGTFDR